ncbi:MAG TPA: molybdopterin-dependent oxidoreductase [Streptosporangiaceae bacterium]|nr:molybdopterin-dependent oxidoreductase [Streptosporangiaceae bacterium]
MNKTREAAGALAGLLAGAVALGVSELTAAATGARGAPVVAVGETAINLTPTPVKEFAITHFGTHDKEALIIGILIMLAGFAAIIGLLALRRLAFGLAGLAAFAAVGVAAVVRLPGAALVDVVPTLVGAAVAVVALLLLMRAIRMVWIAPSGVAPAPTGMDRRRLLVAGAGTAVVAAGAGGLGSLLLGRGGAVPGQVRLPAPALRAAARPAGADLRIPGLTPFVTPNASFYRVDTDLVLPQLSPETWTLKIDGMVGRELEISFADLLRMPLTEADITMVCVSNQVGGTYSGNARWLGVPLAGLLRRAGMRAGADQVLSAATDGMTISTPVETIMDGRNALLAVGMNGQPLPVAHGFPARMIVSGLYGYVSATKWVTKLTLTTFARQQAYWTQRGYSAQAPIKTESRIDVPKPLAQVKAGPVTVAGVAWAPHKGIAAVEVSTDNGPWHQATLAAGGLDTWRQWRWDWDAAPGLHTLRVRATDKTGTTQTPQRAGPVPNGASGWDSTVVTVT